MTESSDRSRGLLGDRVRVGHGVEGFAQACRTFRKMTQDIVTDAKRARFFMTTRERLALKRKVARQRERRRAKRLLARGK